MSEFTMWEVSEDVDAGQMFDGLCRYVDDIKEKPANDVFKGMNEEEREKRLREIEEEWKAYYLRVGIKMAVRCKQCIVAVPLSLFSDVDAKEMWNGYKGE